MHLAQIFLYSLLSHVRYKNFLCKYCTILVPVYQRDIDRRKNETIQLKVSFSHSDLSIVDIEKNMAVNFPLAKDYA